MKTYFVLSEYHSNKHIAVIAATNIESLRLRFIDAVESHFNSEIHPPGFNNLTMDQLLRPDKPNVITVKPIDDPFGFQILIVETPFYE